MINICIEKIRILQQIQVLSHSVLQIKKQDLQLWCLVHEYKIIRKTKEH